MGMRAGSPGLPTIPTGVEASTDQFSLPGVTYEGQEVTYEYGYTTYNSGSRRPPGGGGRPASGMGVGGGTPNKVREVWGGGGGKVIITTSFCWGQRTV